MIVLIDNYDSFSYNLYQLIGQLNPDIKVIRNDEMTVEALEGLHPDHLIISPGPGRPSDAGICEQAIRYFEGKIPILGVCLGHQAICEVYGGTIPAEIWKDYMSSAASDEQDREFSVPAGMERIRARAALSNNSARVADDAKKASDTEKKDSDDKEKTDEKAESRSEETSRQPSEEARRQQEDSNNKAQ